jgi:hypothetical protein
MKVLYGDGLLEFWRQPVFPYSLQAGQGNLEWAKRKIGDILLWCITIIF